MFLCRMFNALVTVLQLKRQNVRGGRTPMNISIQIPLYIAQGGGLRKIKRIMWGHSAVELATHAFLTLSWGVQSSLQVANLFVTQILIINTNYHVLSIKKYISNGALIYPQNMQSAVLLLFKKKKQQILFSCHDWPNSLNPHNHIIKEDSLLNIKSEDMTHQRV